MTRILRYSLTLTLIAYATAWVAIMLIEGCSFIHSLNAHGPGILKNTEAATANAVETTAKINNTWDKWEPMLYAVAANGAFALILHWRQNAARAKFHGEQPLPVVHGHDAANCSECIRRKVAGK